MYISPTDRYRVGGSLGTSIYDGPKTEDQQPIAMFFNLPVEEARRLAALTVEALNAPHAHLHWRVVYSYWPEILCDLAELRLDLAEARKDTDRLKWAFGDPENGASRKQIEKLLMHCCTLEEAREMIDAERG